MPKPYLVKIDALKAAQKKSEEKKEMYSVILDARETKYYVEEGTGGMIRNFESIVATYENGKKIKL